MKSVALFLLIRQEIVSKIVEKALKQIIVIGNNLAMLLEIISLIMD